MSETDYPFYLDGIEVSDLLDVPRNMIDKFLLITATFSHFRVLRGRLPIDTGIVRLTKTGYQVTAGFSTGKKLTSEIFMHILAHSERLKQNKAHRIVVYNHANNIVLYK